MSKTSQEIDALCIINQKLRDEGAHTQLADMAKSMAKGQFGNARYDKIGATKIMIDAVVHMLIESPIRPKCCLVCDLGFLQKHLQVVAIEYTGQILGQSDDNA
ncbi:MAG: hypothetical protein JXQ79_03250 [Rhodobacteraceae bacterium]|nr:hypothetical protein [Paracoccaceae bacterium]